MLSCTFTFSNMAKKDPSFYKKHWEALGWGERSAKLDKERVKLLHKYLVGKKILDIGCGSGIYVDYLSSQGFNCTGVDFVKEFIDQATKAKKGQFIKASAENLPFKDNEFDSTYLFDVLEHGDDVKILKEAKRVTKKRLLVIVPKTVDDRLSDSGVIFRHYIDKSHLREYQKEDFQELARHADLKLSHVEPIHPLYNEAIFMALFDGPILWKKIIRKLVLFLLPEKKYPTEYFAVFER